jgi:hypothetical protein
VSLNIEGFNAAGMIDVSIGSLEVVYENPSTANVTILIVVENPTGLSLKLGSIWVDLYLDDWSNSVGEGFVWIPQYLAKDLPPGGNYSVTIIVPVENVDAIDIQPPRTWLATCSFWIYGLPLSENGANFDRYPYYQEIP